MGELDFAWSLYCLSSCHAEYLAGFSDLRMAIITGRNQRFLPVHDFQPECTMI
jgi:hypothetical protein